MHNVIFYEKENGQSDVWDYLEELRIKSTAQKDARIQYNQMRLTIQLLQNNGTYLPESVTKHLDGEIWELRPGNNRVLYFFHDEDDAYVLLHHFRKKSQKTPRREIEKAKAERDDYIKRRGASRI